jgi:hypothetical protein
LRPFLYCHRTLYSSPRVSWSTTGIIHRTIRYVLTRPSSLSCHSVQSLSCFCFPTLRGYNPVLKSILRLSFLVVLSYVVVRSTDSVSQDSSLCFRQGIGTPSFIFTHHSSYPQPSMVMFFHPACAQSKPLGFLDRDGTKLKVNR